jgi:DNA-binding protein HU-beta
MKKIVNLDSAERVGKQYLIDYLMVNGGQSRADAEESVNGVLEAIVTALRSGTPVALSNIGTLRPDIQAARPRRNPQTGETFVSPSQLTVRWKASPTLVDVLNGRIVRDSLSAKAPKGSLK